MPATTNAFGQNRNSASQQGHNLGNQGWDAESPMRNWMDQFQPDQMGWQGGGQSPWGNMGDPGHGGQDFRYNPRTGESSYQDRAGLGLEGGESIWRIDPVTGDKVINPQAIMQWMNGGGEGGSGYQNYEMTDYGGGNVTPGAGYEAFDYETIGSGIDPQAVIQANEYKLKEGMEGDFAQAGSRAGQSGFDMSTPYMGELGAAARKASQDRNAMSMQYQFQAAESQAARDRSQQEQAANLDFGGWETNYQGDLQSQMFNAGQGFDQWAMENQFGFQDNQGQNLYNQQNSNNMMSMLQQMMG